MAPGRGGEDMRGSIGEGRRLIWFKKENRRRFGRRRASKEERRQEEEEIEGKGELSEVNNYL